MLGNATQKLVPLLVHISNNRKILSIFQLINESEKPVILRILDFHIPIKYDIFYLLILFKKCLYIQVTFTLKNWWNSGIFRLQKLEMLRKAKIAEDACSLCYTNSIDTIFKPCGHGWVQYTLFSITNVGSQYFVSWVKYEIQFSECNSFTALFGDLSGLFKKKNMLFSLVGQLIDLVRVNFC